MTNNESHPNTQHATVRSLPLGRNTFHVSRFTFHVSRLTLALFLFLFSVYLLTYTPRINSSDGQAMFATAESMVRRGALDIEQLRWMDLQQGTFGLDGLLYSRKGIGVPVGLLPLTWLGLVVPWWGAVGTSLLFNAIVTALTAVIILAYLQELGFSRRTGLIVALAFGLTTLAWPYAKSLFSDPFSGLLLLGTAYALLKFSKGVVSFSPAPPPLRSPASRLLLYPFIAGLLLGWNVATRYAEAIFVPIFGLLFLYYLLPISLFTTSPRLRLTFHASCITPHLLLPLLAFILPLFLIGLALIAFNLSRYGDPLNTGYLPNETFSGILWQGLLGQLVSPGRGLFLYCPIFLLSLVGFFPFFRRHRPEAIAALSVILIHLFLYGKWFMWHGGYAWGPRFLVPTLPFWAIFLAPVVEKMRGEEDARNSEARTRGEKDETASSPHRLIASSSYRLTASSPLRLIFIALAVLGLIPQFLSLVIDFAPFQNSLLDAGLPLFDPQTFFDPQYSPFVSAWKFISANSLDLAWAWQGQINGWLFAMLIANMGLTGFNLWLNAPMGEETGRGHKARQLGGFFSICILSTLFAVTFLLIHVHTLPSGPLTEVVAALNEGVRPADAVITNDPEAAQSFAELYKGRAPVLGLNSGGPPLPGEVTRRVHQTVAHHDQVWWLPNGLLPEQSAVEHLLMSQGFRARSDDFQGQRLALFVYSKDLDTVKIEAIFAGQIKLAEAAYQPRVSAGEALPIELRWQTGDKLAEDYHIFIHLVSHEGQTVAQADGQPALWTRPTTTWAIGETIVDRHGLWLSPQTQPGDYQLHVGLYRPPEGQRLRLATGEEFIKLPVTIE